jgi:hypothetical protein
MEPRREQIDPVRMLLNTSHWPMQENRPSRGYGGPTKPSKNSVAIEYAHCPAPNTPGKCSQGYAITDEEKTIGLHDFADQFFPDGIIECGRFLL